MDPAAQVTQTLDQMGITYQLVRHPVATTTAEADHYIEGIAGVRTKTMFLTNQKKTADYLVIMDDQQRLDFHRFQALTGAKRPKMASDDRLATKLGLQPGIVSIFGLLNNADHDVQVYFDQAIMDQARMSFHPNSNTSTIFVATEDLLRFLKALKYDYQVIDLTGASS